MCWESDDGVSGWWEGNVVVHVVVFKMFLIIGLRSFLESFFAWAVGAWSWILDGWSADSIYVLGIICCSVSEFRRMEPTMIR